MGRYRLTPTGIHPDDGPRSRANRVKPERRVWNSARWHRTRAAIKARDGGCLSCGHPGNKDNPLSVDHIIPLDEGGAPFDEVNLQTLCRRCHGRKDGVRGNARKKAAEKAAARYHADTVAHMASMDARRSIDAQRRQERQAALAADRRHTEEKYRDRAVSAMRMRESGATWKAIAKTLGFSSPGHAHNVVYGGDGRVWAPGRDGVDGAPALVRRVDLLMTPPPSPRARQVSLPVVCDAARP